MSLPPFLFTGFSSVREPACEDTEEELRERVYRSTLSAVDIEHIERDRFTTVRCTLLRFFVDQRVPDGIFRQKTGNRCVYFELVPQGGI